MTPSLPTISFSFYQWCGILSTSLWEVSALITALRSRSVKQNSVTTCWVAALMEWGLNIILRTERTVKQHGSRAERIPWAWMTCASGLYLLVLIGYIISFGLFCFFSWFLAQRTDNSSSRRMILFSTQIWKWPSDEDWYALSGYKRAKLRSFEVSLAPNSSPVT